jgi:hypothetical protein
VGSLLFVAGVVGAVLRLRTNPDSSGKHVLEAEALLGVMAVGELVFLLSAPIPMDSLERLSRCVSNVVAPVLATVVALAYGLLSIALVFDVGGLATMVDATVRIVGGVIVFGLQMLLIPVLPTRIELIAAGKVFQRRRWLPVASRWLLVLACVVLGYAVLASDKLPQAAAAVIGILLSASFASLAVVRGQVAGTARRVVAALTDLSRVTARSAPTDNAAVVTALMRWQDVSGPNVVESRWSVKVRGADASWSELIEWLIVRLAGEGRPDPDPLKNLKKKTKKRAFAPPEAIEHASDDELRGAIHRCAVTLRSQLIPVSADGPAGMTVWV